MESLNTFYIMSSTHKKFLCRCAYGQKRKGGKEIHKKTARQNDAGRLRDDMGDKILIKKSMAQSITSILNKSCVFS